MSGDRFSDLVHDWWAFLVFVVGSVTAFWLGTKRSQWQLQQAIKDIDELKLRVRETERGQREEAVALGEIARTLEGFARNQERILTAITDLQKSKADK